MSQENVETVGRAIAAINGRAVHAYHAEGAGGGPYDLLEIVAQPNVIPSSTNPTIPYTIHTSAEHHDMLMTVHGLNPAFPEDVLAARHRIRPATMAAETPLHDLGAISITASDSLGMGRIGETIARTWQMAHAMQEQAQPASSRADANERVLRYLAKYTINPAIAHGLSQHIGTLEPGKLADFAVLADDPSTVPPEALKDVRVVGTMVGGVPFDVPTAAKR